VSQIAVVVPASTKGRCEARPTGRVRIEVGFGEDESVIGRKEWKALELGKRAEWEGGKGGGRVGSASGGENVAREGSWSVRRRLGSELSKS